MPTRDSDGDSWTWLIKESTYTKNNVFVCKNRLWASVLAAVLEHEAS